MERIEAVELLIVVLSFGFTLYTLSRLGFLPKLKLPSHKVGNIGAFEVNQITNQSYAEIKGLDEK